ncbi:MAG: LPS export ABC transporter periplasmic protein LptC [Parvularculaceae bacterium]|nr:LPS export ABC transporter periplasmic protein LptC [Parvularculaceae bacterium]
MKADEEPFGGMTNPVVHDRARQVQRHSTVVRHLRLVVPAVAVGLALTYAFSATPPQVDPAFAEQFRGLETGEDGARLASPRYSGEDLSGQPFEVAANTATRTAEDADVVELDNPQATRVTEQGKTLTVTALNGEFDQQAQVMDLRDRVEMQEQSAGGTFVLSTEDATMDLESQVVTANSEVRGVGDGITLRADRGQVFQNEDRQVLEGLVRMRLAPKKVDETAQEADSQGQTDTR